MVRVVETWATEGALTNRLSVSIAVGEGERSDAEFGQVRDVLTQWQKSGRSAKGFLEIELQTEESQSSDLLRELIRVISGRHGEMYDFYRDLKAAEICAVAPSGERIKKVGFSH